MAEQISTDQAKELIENGIAQAQELLNDPEKIQELMNDLAAKVKELPSSATESLANIPLMASMVKSYVTREYTVVSPKVVATLVSAFIYLVTKKDLVRDDIPVLGLVDDLAVVAIAMKIDEKELADYKAWRDAQGLEAPVIEEPTA